MSKFWKSTSLLLTPFMVIGLQVGTLGAAHAAGDADLSVSNNMNFSNAAHITTICNGGTDDVTQVVLSFSLTN